MNRPTATLAITLLLFFALAAPAPAQTVFEGKMEGYDRGPARFAAGLMQPFPIGSVAADGTFSIPLDTTFLQKLEASAQTEDDDPDGWKVRLKTLDRAFGRCRSDTIAITNGSQRIVQLSMFNSYPILNFAEKEDYGFMIAASSLEFARVINAYENGDDIAGYQIDWYYLEEPATVRGTCTSQSYTMTQREEDLYEIKVEYDLDFQAGWNIVWHGYTDIYTDSAGDTYASRIVYKTLEEMPDDVQFLYVPQ